MKTAVVTGGGTGVGRSIALKLADQGWRVAIIGRRIEALEETFNGEVMAISPIADTVGGDVVFKVTIAFDEQPKDLLWGMTAEVTIGS